MNKREEWFLAAGIASGFAFEAFLEGRPSWLCTYLCWLFVCVLKIVMTRR